MIVVSVAEQEIVLVLGGLMEQYKIVMEIVVEMHSLMIAVSVPVVYLTMKLIAIRIVQAFVLVMRFLMTVMSVQEVPPVMKRIVIRIV
jgi:hypothetical protein